MYSNLKIFATALTFRFMLKKRLNVLHWFFITLLMAGLLVATPQPTSDRKHEKKVALGTFLVVIVCLSSAFAGVYFEQQLKTAKEHPVLQNLVLYCLTSLMCATVQLFRNEMADGWRTFFEGQTFYVWGAILSGAIYGQVVALTLYFCDNMVKVFASSLATFASAILDFMFFGKEIGFNVCVGGLLVLFATTGYYCRHESLLEEDVVFIASQSGSSWIFAICICLVFSFLLLSASSKDLPPQVGV